MVSSLIGLGVLARRWDRRARYLILALSFFFTSTVIGVYARQAEHDLRRLRLPIATTPTIHRHS